MLRLGLDVLDRGLWGLRVRGESGEVNGMVGRMERSEWDFILIVRDV